MKTIFVYMLILILAVGMLAGCRRRTEDETTTPTGASETNTPTSATQSTQSTQATKPNDTKPTEDRNETGGMMDDMVTQASEFIDDVLPGTSGGNQSGSEGNGNSGGGNASRGRMPGRSRG